MHSFALPFLMLMGITMINGVKVNVKHHSKVNSPPPTIPNTGGVEVECIYTWKSIINDYMSTQTTNKGSSEIHMNTDEIIRHRGYPVETYYVTTQDGYILATHRIPYGPKSPKSNHKIPVLLVHGFLADSSDFVISPTNASLAFWLVDHGYDVWLANSRGSLFSRNHTTLDPNKDSKYWAFSYDEMGKHDVKAMINQILEKTGQEEIFYIGHSQGNMVFWVAMAEHPELNNKIKAMFALGPAGFFIHLISPFKVYCVADVLINDLVPGEPLDMEFNLPDSVRDVIEIALCGAPNNNPICKSRRLYFTGAGPHNIDKSLYASILSHGVQGTSYKDVHHLCQNSDTGSFNMYDYGPDKNKKLYKSPSPPAYNLTKVTAPVHMYSGTCDRLTTPEDSQLLASKLGRKPLSFTSVPGFDHMSYLMSHAAVKEIFEKIDKQMKDSVNNDGPKLKKN